MHIRGPPFLALRSISERVYVLDTTYSLLRDDVDPVVEEGEQKVSQFDSPALAFDFSTERWNVWHQPEWSPARLSRMVDDLSNDVVF